ncbi:MAG: DUF2088 domain-containing protein [Limisphaerales bacterium]
MRAISDSLEVPSRSVPRLFRVKQQFDPRCERDPRGVTREKVLGIGLGSKIAPQSTIAITAGSRGFGGFAEILAGIVDAVRSVGAQPVIVPSMGSHGGATAEGQTEILRRLGVEEQSIGAPVRATMETIALGQSETGAVAHLDKIAAGCDGIIVLGRVKTHPENAEGVASGLLKMVVVGLGNQIGAQEAHSKGLWDSVEAVPKVTMSRSKILCGVAVVENAYRQPVEIAVVPGIYEAFLDADRRLLKVAQPHAARLPFEQLDLLIVDEMGKTISGTGMDLNVIGKWRLSGGARTPDFHRIVALSLTRESLGNGLGIGLADFTTERFVREFDAYSTYVNLLTASESGVMNTREGAVPFPAPNDRMAIELAFYSSLGGNQPRICRIRNTAHLHEFWVSEALLPEFERHPRLSVESDGNLLPYDEAGNLF